MLLNAAVLTAPFRSLLLTLFANVAGADCAFRFSSGFPTKASSRLFQHVLRSRRRIGVMICHGDSVSKMLRPTRCVMLCRRARVSEQTTITLCGR